MFFRPAVADLDQHNVAEHKDRSKPETILSRGILNDFDMAAELDADGNVRLDAKPHHHITGTLPFMARDLLELAGDTESAAGRSYGPPKLRYKNREPTNLHLYRHDLESFYYILIWAALTYKLRGRSHQKKSLKNHVIKEWLSPDPETVFLSKVSLQTSVFDRKYGKAVSKEWEGLWNDWVVPLNTMFSEALSAADGAYRRRDANFNAITCNGLITFEKFMDVINITPRGLNPGGDV